MVLTYACSPQSETESAAEIPAAGSIAEIRSALDAKNYGQAADRAKAAQSAHPGNPRVHLLAAQSEARLGNAGNAASAFSRAIDNGLARAERELADDAFDQVRMAPTFEAIRRRIRPAARAEARGQARPDSDRETVRAGDLEIIEDASGTYVRAGDIVLDSRP